jgi:hypothetical protein
VEGSFYSYSDSGGSMVTDVFSEGSACINGTAGMVMDDDYASTYGAGMGFNFADESPWNATAQGVTSVGFNISALPDTDVRVIFTTAAGDHCSVLTAAGAQTVTFASTTLDCWEAGGAAPDAAGIISIKWQVVTDAEAAHPFDFCITELTVNP